MTVDVVTRLVVDLLIVLAAGLVSGAICKRFGISLLVGYLAVGALIGEGGLQFVSQEHHELEYLARAGVLLLLFSVGIEFSLEELLRLGRHFLIGGTVQMAVVAVPLFLVALQFGFTWHAALLAAGAGALSSTVLVFKALTEWGQSATPHGRRAIGILLFQDVALVPLILIVPLLTGAGPPPALLDLMALAGKSAALIVGLVVCRRLIGAVVVPFLSGLRSVELVVLFAVCVLTGTCLVSFLLGLPPALGALAAGLMLSGNRLSPQIDTLTLPYRESFSAVFFVTLGTLLHPLAFFAEPWILLAGLCGILVVKTLAASLALKLTGLRWRAAFGMGLGLAQLGEFSFLLIADGLRHGVIDAEDYNRMLFIALCTLILTPQLLKLGLRWTISEAPASPTAATPTNQDRTAIQRAMIIGLGPIGRQLASRLETLGIDVCLLDLSPINLHRFAQQGFQTVTGDARDPSVLRRAGAAQCRFAIVAIPDDDSALQIVRNLRQLSAEMFILVRCRYMGNIHPLTRLGANAVISEEQQASSALVDYCESMIQQS